MWVVPMAVAMVDSWAHKKVDLMADQKADKMVDPMVVQLVELTAGWTAVAKAAQ